MTDDIKKLIESYQGWTLTEVRNYPLDAVRVISDLLVKLEAEHQWAETLEAEVAGMLADSTRWMNRALPAEAERDALRTAIQDALRDLWAVPMSATKEARHILSRAIDTKEKTDG